MRNADPRSLYDYLTDILTSIERIQEYTLGLSEDDFVNSNLVSDAVIRNIEIIGEAATQLSRIYTEFARSNTDLPLRIAADTRNALAQGYYRIALQRIWLTIQRDLPPLHVMVHSKRSELRETSKE